MRRRSVDPRSREGWGKCGCPLGAFLYGRSGWHFRPGEGNLPNGTPRAYSPSFDVAFERCPRYRRGFHGQRARR